MEEMFGDERAAVLRVYRANKGESNGRFGKGRAVMQMSLDGDVIATFPNVSRAAAALGKNPNGIYKCVSSPRRAKLAFGFKWRYADERDS